MNAYNPYHFAIKGGCRKPSRLHAIYRHALEGVCALCGVLIVWVVLVAFMLGA